MAKKTPEQPEEPKKTPAKKTTRKTTAKKTPAKKTTAKKTSAKKTPAKKTTRKKAAAPEASKDVVVQVKRMSLRDGKQVRQARRMGLIGD